MRIGVLTSMIVAAALVAAAPAHAQRASLADRVSALERQAMNTQGNTDILNQLGQLRTQMQAMQSTIEQLQHDNDQLKQQVKNQYLDLDGRLSRIESGAGATPPLPPANGAAPAVAPAPAAVSEPPPSVHGDAGTLAAGGDERAAYDVAFDALKAGKYADSANLFQSFLQSYPNGVYAPNALYWLGESYYATKNFELAEAQFRDLVARYPTHDKTPGALLKVGLSQYGEGRAQDAEQTLQQVIGKYPGSDAARTAQDRLQSIRLSQQLR